MSVSDYTADAFYFLITGGPLLLLGLIVLIVIQSPRLRKKLDHLLFNSNNFNELELAAYNQFPLVMWKVLAYVRAIVFPKSMRRRFGDLDVTNHVSTIDKFLAYLTIIIITLFMFSFINAISSVIFLYFSNQ